MFWHENVPGHLTLAQSAAKNEVDVAIPSEQKLGMHIKLKIHFNWLSSISAAWCAI